MNSEVNHGVRPLLCKDLLAPLLSATQVPPFPQ
jgi:hypothetical protein